MSDNFRIKTNFQNKSLSMGQDAATGTGATVIPANKGPMTPIKLNRGETEKIIMLFGADRYETLEVIAYNNKYPLWVSAPHKGGSTAALLLTDTGLKPCALSFSGDPETIDFNNLCYQYKLGEGNGTTTSFGIVLPSSTIIDLFSNFNNYPKKGAILINDNQYSINITWESLTNCSIVIPNLGTGSGVVDNTNIAFTINLNQAPEDNALISLQLEVDTSKLADKVYGIIGMKFPCDDFMAASIYKSEIKERLILDIRHKKKGVYYQMAGYPVELSLEPKTLNGAGINIYAPELLSDDNFIFVKPNVKVKMDWNSWIGESASAVSFEGGYRGLNPQGDILADSWNQFKSFKKYPADIYFDVTGDPAIPPVLASLRDVIPYRRFLFPLPIHTKASDVTASDPARPANRGLCAFWGAAYITNMYEPTGLLLSTLMGEVAAKYADARIFSYGGRAVAWGDENNVGGQLSQGRIIKFLYDATQEEMQKLDKLRVNPIIFNELFGPIIASRRTTDTSDTDYSYSDYSMIIDYCVERIEKEVLPFQIIKFNDDSHRAIVQMKAEAILKPLLVAPNNVIRDFAFKCDSENNNDDVLARQEFVSSCAIKVTPKSEYIVFNFITSAQGGSVIEDVR